uniref:WH2 domain-containing protein n=1 Tax=Mesocestoides corti TaxID=53468 RepID=A0A5K3FFP8_MESCO
MFFVWSPGDRICALRNSTKWRAANHYTPLDRCRRTGSPPVPALATSLPSPRPRCEPESCLPSCGDLQQRLSVQRGHGSGPALRVRPVPAGDVSPGGDVRAGGAKEDEAGPEQVQVQADVATRGPGRRPTAPLQGHNGDGVLLPRRKRKIARLPGVTGAAPQAPSRCLLSSPSLLPRAGESHLPERRVSKPPEAVLERPKSTMLLGRSRVTPAVDHQHQQPTTRRAPPREAPGTARGGRRLQPASAKASSSHANPRGTTPRPGHACGVQVCEAAEARPTTAPSTDFLQWPVSSETVSLHGVGRADDRFRQGGGASAEQQSEVWLQLQSCAVESRVPAGLIVALKQLDAGRTLASSDTPSLRRTWSLERCSFLTNQTIQTAASPAVSTANR